VTWPLVGTIGAVSVGASGASVTPAWGTGETRAVGNLAVCRVTAIGSATKPAVPTGWSAGEQTAASSSSASIFWLVCAGGDAAPTIVGVTGAELNVQLAEFTPPAGGIPALDQVAAHTGAQSTPQVATTPGADVAAGNLVVTACSASYSLAGATTITDTFNNGASATQTNNNATSTTNHYDFGHGVTTGNGSADSVSIAFTTSGLQQTAFVLASFKAISTTTQTAAGRIQTAPSKTQTAKTRVAKALTATQAAHARIVQTKTQTAHARVLRAPTTTQTAKARIQRGPGDPAALVGVHTSQGFYDAPQHATDDAALAAAKTQMIRFQVAWSDLESTQGAITSWSEARNDDIVANAVAYGFGLVGIIFGAPAWSNSGGSIVTPPSNPNDITFICEYLANRYRGVVAGWEVWNEPNNPTFWVSPNAANYTPLLQAAYPALKSGDPNCTVIGGVTADIDTPFITGMYAAGAHGSMDAVSVHYYPQTNTDSPLLPDPSGTDITKLPHLSVLRSLMVTNGDSALPVWMTEFGWYTTGDPPTNVTQAVQAANFLTVITQINLNYTYVTHALIYKDWDAGGGGVDDGYSILNNDYSPKTTVSAMAGFLTGPPVIQTAKARIKSAVTATQAAHASIASGNLTTTQAAHARVSKAVTSTQTAKGRLSTGRTVTQTAHARIAKPVTTTQTAHARISEPFTKTQTAKGRVAKPLTTVQTAKARASTALTTTQTAKAHIAGGSSVTQTASARISAAITATQGAKGRVRTAATTIQSAKARLVNTPTAVQQAKARAQTSTIIDADSFIRANSATTLGSTDTGQAWTALNGTWGISGNDGYLVTQTSQAIAVLDTGFSNGVLVGQLRMSPTFSRTDAGFVFRVVDVNNHLLVTVTSELGVNQYRLYSRASGIYTQLASSGAVTPPGNGQYVTVGIIYVGTSITVVANDVQIITYNTATGYETATKVGIRINYGATSDDTGTRFSSITATYAGGTQIGYGRVSVTPTATQTAKSRVTATPTKPQTARARIVGGETRTQTAVARVRVARTTTQAGHARLATTPTTSQPAAGRVSAALQASQTASATITGSPTASQQALARLLAYTPPPPPIHHPVRWIFVRQAAQDIDRSATMYFLVPVAAIDDFGQPYDPTQLVVSLAFLTASTARPGLSDWNVGSWQVSNASTPVPSYFARCLIGPQGGQFNPTPSTYPFDFYAWVMIAGSPENVVSPGPVGILTIT
jgi:hypothetical protein